MRPRARPVVAAALLLALLLGADAAEMPAPRLGYAFPAGGARGTTVAVTLGGQSLRGANAVRVTGQGVTGRVVDVSPPFRRFDPEEMKALRRELGKARDRLVRGGRGAGVDRAGLPDHPLLADLDRLGPEELRKVAEYFFDRDLVVQASPQIAERVRIEIEIAPDAAPGPRELRLATALGLTNPVRFEIGAVPEVLEREIDDFAPMPLPAPGAGLVVNGQVDRRDVDRFRIPARAGTVLEVRCEARLLVPFLADAVPGWFQATLTLLDPAGEEAAFADDTSFDPDPVLRAPIPADGEYVLLVRDAIWRGREDFVYRLAIRELPVGGDPAAVPAPPEPEPNDTPATATPLAFPGVAAGRIARPGDVDLYRIGGTPGAEVVAEVEARPGGSPLDAVLHALDGAGAVLAANDDAPDPRIGLLTHAADPRLTFRVPPDGTAFLRVADVTGHGGPACAYRLRVRPPRPDFDLYVTPSALNVPPTGTVPLVVRAVRRDGFAGEIGIELDRAPRGVVLSAARIPPGRDRVRLTLSVPARGVEQTVPIRIAGRAEISGADVRRIAVPADETMQAFAYWHVVPAEELLLSRVRTRYRLPAIELAGPGPVRLSPGGTATVLFRAAGLPSLDRIRFALSDPPAGVTLAGATATPDGLVLTLAAAADAAADAAPEPLIVTVSADGGRGRETPLGVLPAIGWTSTR